MQNIIQEKKYAADRTLQDIAEEVQGQYSSPIVAAYLDYVLRDLQTPVGDYHDIQFVTLDSWEGQKVYARSVKFLFIVALHELFPSVKAEICYSGRGGFHCIDDSVRPFTTEILIVVEKRMHALVEEARAIKKKILAKASVEELFRKSHQDEKADLIAAMPRSTVSIYYCGDFYDYLYGPMVGNTSLLKDFSLYLYEGGIYVQTPDLEMQAGIPLPLSHEKLAKVLVEAKRWARILHCNYIPDLNQCNKAGDIGDLIRISEALHEKKIAEIADFILRHKESTRLILIAGPSSSGKTSFAQRLRIQLRVNGLEPVSISLDDYFIELKKTPKNAQGEYDTESIRALDLALLNQHMVKLLSGETILPPRYNFVTGKREWEGQRPLHIAEDQPIIVEGIHGLNEKLSQSIPRENKYKIYVSPFTQLNLDAHNTVSTRDARLIRRLVRDYQTRGSHALKTLRQWPAVKAGEEKYIFPFQEDANVIFNSALIYELGILKKYALPLLGMISPDVPEYGTASRLLDLLLYFDDIYAEEAIPQNSILREFIGKSCFFS